MPRRDVLGGLAVIAAAFLAAFGVGTAMNGSAAAGMPPRAMPIEVDEAVIAADVATGAELPPLSADVAPAASQPKPTPTPDTAPRRPAVAPDAGPSQRPPAAPDPMPDSIPDQAFDPIPESTPDRARDPNRESTPEPSDPTILEPCDAECAEDDGAEATVLRSEVDG